MQQDKDTAVRYRNRAVEVRTIADEMKDARTKQILMGVARGYERMAGQLDDAAEIDRRLAEIGKPRISFQ